MKITEIVFNIKKGKTTIVFEVSGDYYVSRAQLSGENEFNFMTGFLVAYIKSYKHSVDERYKGKYNALAFYPFEVSDYNTAQYILLGIALSLATDKDGYSINAFDKLLGAIQNASQEQINEITIETSHAKTKIRVVR